MVQRTSSTIASGTPLRLHTHALSSMSSTPILVLLPVLLLSLLLSPTSSLRLYHVTSLAGLNLSSSAISLHSSSSPSSPSLSLPSVLVDDVASLSSLSGCPVQSGSSVRLCNFSSPITVRGSGFAAPSTITISGSIQGYAAAIPCSTVTLSNSSLLFPPACYYWPPDIVLNAQVTSNGSSTNSLTGAISFSGTSPTVSAVLGCPSSSPCFVGGSSTWLLTVRGSNFFTPYNGSLSLMLWGNERGYAPSIGIERQTATQIVARMAPIDDEGWFRFFGYHLNGAQTLPVSVLANQWWGTVTYNPYSYPVSGVHLYTQRPSSSSSSSPAPPQPPTVVRVSGCSDERLSRNTGECPFAWEGLELTVWGSGFTQPGMPSHILFGNASYLCTIDDYRQGDMLKCRMKAVSVQPTPVSMQLNLSSSFGPVLRANALTFTSNFTAPVIDAVSGCHDIIPTTVNCLQTSILTIRGEHFPRYVEDRYIQLQLGDLLSVPCVWRPADEATLPELACPLSQTNLEPIYQGPNKYVKVRLRFNAPGQPERASEDVEMVGLNLAPQPPQSTGASNPDAAVDDDLDSMKIALMALMVVSLSILTIATLVWGVTWWSAQRRAYVSRNGAAAVDMRQVLLH